MNELYAVDPAAPVDSRELKLLLDQFGLQTGRFVARFPSDWIDEVRTTFARATELERKRAIEILDRRSRGLTTSVSARLKFVPSKPWAENAIGANAVAGDFERIIGCRDNGVGLVTVDEILYNEEKALPSGHGGHLLARAAEYCRVARPLFEASAEIILVDRYFLPADDDRKAERHRRILVDLLRCADTSGKCESFKLVLELPRSGMSRSAAEATCAKHTNLAKFEADLRHVKVTHHLYEDVGHGRYLFSIDGGLQFDHGFDDRPRGDAKNHVHWLSQFELTPLWSRITDQASRTGQYPSTLSRRR